MNTREAARPASTGKGGGDESQTTLLYEVRKKIYPRAVTGRFAVWRWVLVWLTQIVFYGLPWLNWGDRPAVLFDLEARRFYLFNLVLYPQDFIYLTGLLVISALALFLFTTVAGRLWCGYACPQTVYTEIFMWIEQKLEGDRNARMKLDKAPMSRDKFLRKGGKHVLWVLVALWTGITFVGFFTPIRELLVQIAGFSTGPWETFWILFYAFATWGNAGFMREQVCTYMCPYARFQGVMFDRDTLTITYDYTRGEPRGSRSKKVDRKEVGLGDCIDCNLCVHVCPTGIDIRDGLQYECIGCAACIDACDQVMDKMNYPRGLIRYTTENALAAGTDEGSVLSRLVRPRVLIYTAIVLAITVALLANLFLRSPVKVDVIPDRSLGREVEEGMIENTYRLQLINSVEQVRRFVVSVEGVDTIFVAGQHEFEVGPAGTRLVPLVLRVKPDHGNPGSNPIRVSVQDADNPSVTASARSTFFVPRR